MRFLVSALVLAWVSVGSATAPAAAEEPVVQDVLDILKERGLVDEGQYTALSAKNLAYEEEQDGLLGRIEWSGDFRGRFESFWFDRDETGNRQDDRQRLRYRLRLQGKAEINEYIDAVFRLASGEAVNFDEGTNRSTNRTLGRSQDFNANPVFIDLAYIDVHSPDDWIEGVEVQGLFGKVPNPFRWKHGPDFMIWDSDINPEGVAGRLTYDVDEDWNLFLNGGYFIADENSSDADPHVWAVQGGVEGDVTDEWHVGARGSFYSWRSLNNAFFRRSNAFGTVEDGLVSDAPTVGASTFRVLEVGGYVRYDAIEGWPILLFVDYAQNLDAVSSDLFPAAGKEDTGWGIGVEAGDKRHIAAFGLGYYHLEANYTPAQFIDSDVTDGYTNRGGWHVYGLREILPNTDLSVELLWSEPVRTSLPDFEGSVAASDRIRLRTDVIVKF
jgi:hypothetical protein